MSVIAKRTLHTETASRRSTSNGHAKNLAVAKKTKAKAATKKRPTPKPIPFYAKVEVARKAAVPTAAIGAKGIVLGRSKMPGGAYSYAVFLSGINETCSLPHSSLKATGEVLKREDIYGGETIGVSVNKSGEGVVVSG